MPARTKPEHASKVIEVGKRLSAIRKERGFTQVELASKLGISQAVVSEYERGESRFTAPMLIRIAEILVVSTDTILGLESSKISGHKPNRRLLRRLEQIERLPQRKQDALVQTIDAFLKAGEA